MSPIPKLPASSAGLNEVRAYLVRVLMSQDISADVADEIANKWRVGWGAELHDASINRFSRHLWQI